MTVDDLIRDYSKHLQKVYDERTAGDYTFKGVLADFAGDVKTELEKRSNPIATEVPHGTNLHTVVYVDNLTDLGYSVAGACMLSVAPGIFFHARLMLLIVEKSSLPAAVGNHLPS